MKTQDSNLYDLINRTPPEDPEVGYNKFLWKQSHAQELFNQYKNTMPTYEAMKRVVEEMGTNL